MNSGDSLKIKATQENLKPDISITYGCTSYDFCPLLFNDCNEDYNHNKFTFDHW